MSSLRNSPLHDAVEANDLHKVKVVLSSGIDVNIVGKFGRIPLHLAAKIKNLDMVEFLLERGADPNIKNTHGFTPLYVAAVADNAAVIALLAKIPSVDIDAVDLGGMSPLISAACNGCSAETISCLLNLEASTSLRDSLGRNATDWAKQKNFVHIHPILLRYSS
jgi:ankyrin repeat protein